MPNFYLYSKSHNAFLMQKDLGHTDRMDIAGVFSRDEAISILEKENANAIDLESRAIVPINALQPSLKPSELENKLNFRVYTYLSRRNLTVYGLGDKDVSFGAIFRAYKSMVTLEKFIESQIELKANLLIINKSLYHEEAIHE